MGILKVVGVAAGAVTLLAAAALGGTYLHWRARVDAVIDTATAHLGAVAAQPDSRPSYLEPGPPAGTFAERAGWAAAALHVCDRSTPAGAAVCDQDVDAWLAAPRAPALGGPSVLDALVSASRAAVAGDDRHQQLILGLRPTPVQRADARMAAHASAQRTREHLVACLDRLAWSRELDAFGSDRDMPDALLGSLDRPWWLHHCVLSLAAAEPAILAELAPSVARLRAGFPPASHHRTRRATGTASLVLEQAGGEDARQALSEAARRMLAESARALRATEVWDAPTLRFRVDDPVRSCAELERLERRLAKALAPTDPAHPEPPPSAARAQLELFATALALRSVGGARDDLRRHPALAGKPLAEVAVTPEGPGWRLTAAGGSLVVPPRAPADANARLAAARAAGHDEVYAEPPPPAARRRRGRHADETHAHARRRPTARGSIAGGARRDVGAGRATTGVGGNVRGAGPAARFAAARGRRPAGRRGGPVARGAHPLAPTPPPAYPVSHATRSAAALPPAPGRV